MMRSHRPLLRPALLLVAGAVACVAGPFEHTNYHDPARGVQLTITGAPDTVYAAMDTFELAATSDPPPPAGSGISFVVITGAALVEAVGGTKYRVVPSAVGLLPAPVEIRARVLPLEDAPRAVARIMVRQRPTTLALTCVGATPCAGVGIGGTAIVSLAMTDARGFSVNLPAGAYRFGTAVSRTPGVATVSDRPLPNTIAVQGVSAGSSWIVLSEGTLRDSILVTVVP